MPKFVNRSKKKKFGSKGHKGTIAVIIYLGNYLSRISIKTSLYMYIGVKTKVIFT